MKTILYNPIFINPHAYYVFPQLYSMEPKTDTEDYTEEVKIVGFLRITDLTDDHTKDYSNTNTIDFSEYAGHHIRIDMYVKIGAVALGEWNIPEGQPSKPLRKATLSLGWTADELNNQGVIYDKDLKLNRVNFSTNVRFFVWDSEETSGTIQKIDSYGLNEDVQKIGQVTGDDSGIFPDDVLLRAVRYNGNPTNTYGYRRAQITLDPGHYNLRLFMSLNKTQKDGSKFLKIQTIIDDVATDFTIPEDYSLSGNLTRWLEQEIHITESGKFELRFGFENVTIGWVPCPLNVMEIEEI